MRDLDQMAAGVRQVAGGGCWPTPEQLRQFEDRRRARRRRVTVSTLLAVLVLAGAIAFPAVVAARSRTATAIAAVPVSPLPGTLYYLSPGYDSRTGVLADQLTLYSRTGDGPPRVVGTFPASDGRMFEMTVTVSPDGRRLAWVEGADSVSYLYTSMIDGSGRHWIAGISGGPDPLCSRPVWTPDSRQIIYPEGDGLSDIVDVVGTGGVQRLKVPWRCDNAMLPDGQHVAWSDYPTNDPTVAHSSIVVGDIGTGGIREYLIPHNVSRLVAISPDTRHAVVVRYPNGGAVPGTRFDQVGWHEGSTLVDVRTGNLLPSPVPGDIIEATYQKDGTLLLRYVDRNQLWVSLVDARGAIVARSAETDALTQDDLIGYVH
jgi:hypothetical protein